MSPRSAGTSRLGELSDTCWIALMAFPRDWTLKGQRSIQFPFRRMSCSYTCVSVTFSPDQNQTHASWYPMVFGVFLPQCGAVQVSPQCSPDGPGREHCAGPFVLFLFPFSTKGSLGHFLPESRHPRSGHFQSTCSGHKVSALTHPRPNSSKIMA